MKKLYDIILFICSIALCVSALWLIAIEITDTPDVYMSYETKVCRKVIIYDGPNEIRGSCKKLPKKYNYKRHSMAHRYGPNGNLYP